MSKGLKMLNLPNGGKNFQLEILLLAIVKLTTCKSFQLCKIRILAELNIQQLILTLKKAKWTNILMLTSLECDETKTYNNTKTLFWRLGGSHEICLKQPRARA